MGKKTSKFRAITAAFTAAVALSATLLVSGNTSSASAASAPFTHPGVLVNRAQLDFVKAKLSVNAEPWKSAMANAMTTKQRYHDGTPGQLLSSLSYTPKPVTRVECLTEQASSLNIGCADVLNDAQAAYLHALLWYYTGSTASAQKSIEIMNAWSAKHTSFRYEYNTYRQGLLAASWAGEVFPRAAEIIRYTYTPAAGQPKLNVTAFKNYLNNVYLPRINVEKGTTANWLMSMAAATMNIGIFTDNRTTYNSGVALWRRELPAMIYMSGDTSQYPQLAGLPIPPDDPNYDTPSVTAAKMNTLWYNPSAYISGLEQETCRDTAHMSMGFGSMLNAAETARIQGLDLYGQNQSRILAGMKLNTGYIAAAIGGNNVPPNWKCSAPINIDINGANAWMLTYEIGYNHYANRKGVALPEVNTVITEARKHSYRAAFGLDWETLTNAGTP